MGAAKLCVTVTGQTMAELRKRRDDVVDADLVELRLDTVSDPDAAAALAGRKVPVVVTCRAPWEGGHFRGAEEERLRLLREAQQLGAEYVDVEWKAAFRPLLSARNGRGVVLSMHDFNGIPADLPGAAAAMRGSGAEIVKIAVMAHRLSDVAGVLPIADRSSSSVIVVMGDAGLVSRVLPQRFGSAWTYAGDGVAPGQITAQRLHEFGFDRRRATPVIYGVVGRPIMHSLSPAMHNAAFSAVGADGVYLPLAASDFDDFEVFANAFELKGASVTAPFKLAAFDRADAADEVSRRVKSVNTLRRHGGRWEACNTDVAGFLSPLEHQQVALHGRRATILGAGGAARAAAEGLIGAGAHVSIAARRRDAAGQIADQLGCAVGEWPPPRGSWDLLVNTTPIGTAPDVDASPLPDGPFSGEVVYDLVYNPPDTRLLRDAKRAGCRTIGGLHMLVAQAERQFEWWTGHKPPSSAMYNAALAALNSRSTLSTLGTLR